MALAGAEYSQGNRVPWLECRRSSGWKVPNCTQRTYRSSATVLFGLLPQPVAGGGPLKLPMSCDT